MADWRKVALAMTLADGKVSERETAILRRELIEADGKLDRAELEFLLEVKKRATTTAPSFNEFVNLAVKKLILHRDGAISPGEVQWLAQWIFHDGKVTPDERELLHALRKDAKLVCPEFQTLYDRCMRA